MSNIANKAENCLGIAPNKSILTQNEPDLNNKNVVKVQWGANFQIIGKTDPQNLSGPWAWQNQTGTLADLADHLRKGHPFMPSLLSGNRRRWQSNANYATMLALDIDDGMTIAEALEHRFIRRHCGLGIETTSSKPDHNKFRLVFPLATAIEGWQNIKLATLYLQHLVGSADKSCSDASRFYFGSLGRSPFILQDVTLPANFLEQAEAWQAERDRVKAEKRAQQERIRREHQERIRAAGNADLVELVEQANYRLGVDAFLPYLEYQLDRGGKKYRCLPVFRTGSGTYSAFVAENDGLWRYHDTKSEHSLTGFRFFVWQRYGEGFKPTGKDFVELAKEYCSIAGIDVPEWTPTRTIETQQTKPKSKAQQEREWRNLQADITRKAILKPFGDRSYDLTCSTKAELEQAILANPYCFIDGPTGSGKTEAFKVLLDHEVNHIGFNPLRSLSRGAAAALGQAYWNTNRRGILDSAWACIHSVLAVLSAPRLYDRTYLYFDELEQSLEALLTSKLCEVNRDAKIQALQDECSKAERIVAASATAAIKDLNYLESISGKRFTLIRFDPKLHQKGSFTIYTSQEDVKGSNKAALNYVRSLSASPKTYIASDSSDKAIETLLRSDIPTLLANQRTSEEEEVKALLSSPNPGDYWDTTGYSNLVSSPLVQSGFSLKGNHFDQVLGVFTGKSISPSNCVQQLERDRSSVPRICYAPRYSAPRASIGTGRSPRGVGSFKERQSKQWELEADQLQNTVRTGAFTGFNFLAGPEREWYREWEIQRDREFRSFATAIEAYATRQGFTVEYATPPGNIKLQSLRDEVNDWKATPVFTRGNDRPLHKSEVADLLADGKELSQTDSDRIEAYLIRDYYGLAWNAPLTKENVIAEGFGDGRKALRKALRILWDGQAQADDQAQRDKLGDRGYLWDTTNHALTLKWWDRLGIDDVLSFCLENPYSSASPEIREFSDRLAEHQEELGEGSRVLGVKIPWRYEDAIEHCGKVVKWIGMMLKSFGIETKSHRIRDDFGNNLPRVYTIVPETLDKLRDALKHKAEKQIRQGFTPRSTPLFKSLYKGVDQGNYFVLWEEYSRAMALDDLELATQLAAHLDKFQEF